jgi:hypothetical protein
MLAVSFCTQERGFFREWDRDSLFLSLNRPGDQQQSPLVIGPHDAQPATALSFVQMR